MTSRLGVCTILLIFVTMLTVACGGDDAERTSTSSAIAPTASFADSATPPPSPTAVSTVEPTASPVTTEPAAPSETPTATDPGPTPTELPDVPIGETGNAEIYVMNADGTEQRRLTNLPSTEISPAWSPDGSMLAYLGYAGDSSGLYVMDADGSNVRQLSDAATYRPAWSPDGRQILVVSGHGYEGEYPQIYRVAVDGSGQQRLTSFENVPTASLSMGNIDPAWSPDGTQIAFIALQSDGPSEVHLMDADGSNVRRLTDDSADKWHPVWSPSGDRIAFTTGFPEPEVWVMNADGTDVLNLSNDPAFDIGPSWSSDGSQIAFVRQSDTGNQIMLVNTDGSDLHAIADIQSPVESLHWSPDGATIAFAPFDHSGSTGIYAMHADGSDLRQLTETADGEPAWSPDGAQIAFTSTRDGGQPVNCSWSVIADLAVPGSIEELTWMSELVVTGTIVEELGPAFGGPGHRDSGHDPEIHTDFMLEVERQFRGHPLESVRLRTPGGTIGDCVQTYEPNVELSEGMRVLLFLSPANPDEELPPAYFANVVGTWTIAANDTIASSPMGHHPPGADGLTIDGIAAVVAETLATEPPPDAFRVVPLEESPATPQ